jgi:hypothetical protein
MWIQPLWFAFVCYGDIVLESFVGLNLLVDVDFRDFHSCISLLLIMVMTRFWGKEFNVWVFL